jgi:hypothetical protein
LPTGDEGEGVDEDVRRAQSKSERAMERLRRGAVRLLDTTAMTSGSKENAGERVRGFLDMVVGVYEGFEVCFYYLI